MKLFLKIWRQKNPESEGKIISYEIDGITEDMSFLEMMDVLNEKISMMEETLWLLTMIAEREYVDHVQCL